MKITKVKTMVGEAQGLAAVEMEKIVERMRSETTKKMAEVIREEAHNAHYQQHSSLQQVLEDIFEPAAERTQKWFWSVLQIQQELAKRLKAKDIPNFRELGTTLKRMGWPRGGIDGRSGYYLKRRSE